MRGWDKGVWDACGPSSMSADHEEKAVRYRVEGGQGHGEGVWACAELGREHLGSAGDRLIVDFGLHRVCRVFLHL
jgi:hypothetical protein